MSDVATLGIGVDLRELQAATKALEAFEKAAAKAEAAGKKIGGVGSAAAGAGGQVSGYTRKANDAAGATDKLGKSAQQTSALMGLLKGMLAGFLTMQTVQILTSTADRMQSLNNQIKLVTGSESAMIATRKELLAISNRTVADLEATGSLYVKSQRALADYGYSQQQVLKFVEATNNAMRVGGVGAQEQSAALFQLSQALGSGRLQGDEFRSISEAAPIMLDIMAKHLGKTRQEVRALASEGALTSQVIVEAMSGAGDMLAQQAAGMTVTLGGALTILRNNFAELVNETLNGSGAMSGLSNMVLFVAQNLQTLAQALAVLGVAYALQMFNGLTLTLGKAGAAMGGLNKVMMANPFVFVAAAIVGVLVATGELGNAMDALGYIVGDVFDLITIGFKGLGDLISAVYTNMTTSADGAVSDSTGIFGGFFDDTGSGFWGLLESVAKVFDAFGAIIASAVAWAVDAFMDLWTAVKNGAAGTANFAIASIESMVNAAIDGINRVISLANKVPGINIGTVGNIALGRSQEGGKPLVGRSFSEIYGERVALQSESGLQAYIRNAQKNVAARKVLSGATGGAGGSMPKAGGAGGKQGGRGKAGGQSDADKILAQYNKELESAEASLKKLRSEFADIDQYGFKNQFTHLQEFNAEMEKANGKYSKFTGSQKEALRNIAEQVHVQQQLNAVQTFGIENKRNLEDYAFEIGLIGQSKEAVERLRFERELENKAKEISVGMSPEYTAKIWAEVAAVKAKREELVRLKEEYGQDWFGGIEDGMRRFVDATGTVRDQVAGITESALGSVADGLGNLFTSAKVSSREMSRAVLADLSKIFIRMAMMRLVSSAVGAFGGGFGEAAAPSAGWTQWSGSYSFDTGGYTGPGGKHEPAGIVHRGEVVFSQDDVRRFGGVDKVEAMRLRGYAAGGVVGSMSAGSSGVGSSGNTTHITVSVTVEGGDSDTEEKARKGVEAGLVQTMKMIAKSEIASSWRPGSISYRMAKTV